MRLAISGFLPGGTQLIMEAVMFYAFFYLCGFPHCRLEMLRLMGPIGIDEARDYFESNRDIFPEPKWFA